MWLITHSLLSAWLYSFKDIDGRDALSELKTTLCRQRIEPTGAMKKGMAFEQEVSRCVQGQPSDNYAAIQFAGLVRGGQEQVRLSRKMKVAGQDFLLYGIADWVRAGVIYDIKHTGSYETGKYRDSTQHPMYFELLQEAVMFAYLVSSGSGIYMEQYTRGSAPSIMTTIEQFSDWVSENAEIKALYEAHWRAS